MQFHWAERFASIREQVGVVGSVDFVGTVAQAKPPLFRDKVTIRDASELTENVVVIDKRHDIASPFSRIAPRSLRDSSFRTDTPQWRSPSSRQYLRGQAASREVFHLMQTQSAF
jgi:hypothetical protein